MQQMSALVDAGVQLRTTRGHFTASGSITNVSFIEQNLKHTSRTELIHWDDSGHCGISLC